jgi:Spy/CpxP family protein refolding chaperone
VALGLALTGCHRAAGDHFTGERAKLLSTWFLKGMLDDIDATPEQRQEILRVKNELIDELADFIADGKDDRALFLAEIQRDEPDEEFLHALLDGRLDARRDFAHDVLDKLLEMRAILTPAQRDKLKKWLTSQLDQRRPGLRRFLMNRLGGSSPM